ncbi:MAG TPA: NADP-dependent oxidoreductase [Myxococcaceae bacterium]
MSATGLAAVVRRFGAPDVIQIERVTVPDPDAGQVRIRVHAAGVGPWDAAVRSGSTAFPAQLPVVLGAELSGEVESVGPGVDSLRVGDVVFGVTGERLTGAYAEVALAKVVTIHRRPTLLTSIEAAAVPVVGCTALQMLELGGVLARRRTLVLGAAGNVGAWATRLAIRRGAEVVGVVEKLELPEARRLGAREMVTSVPRWSPPFDLLLDTVGGALARSAVRLLKPGGRLISSVESIEPASLGRQDVSSRSFMVAVTSARLDLLSRWIEAGGFPVPLGEVLPLWDAARAHRKLEGLEPRAPGSLVLRVSD